MAAHSRNWNVHVPRVSVHTGYLSAHLCNLFVCLLLVTYNPRATIRYIGVRAVPCSFAFADAWLFPSSQMHVACPSTTSAAHCWSLRNRLPHPLAPLRPPLCVLLVSCGPRSVVAVGPLGRLRLFADGDLGGYEVGNETQATLAHTVVSTSTLSSRSMWWLLSRTDVGFIMSSGIRRSGGLVMSLPSKHPTCIKVSCAIRSLDYKCT